MPAFFHYLAALIIVHLEARQLKLRGAEPHLIPKIGPVILTSWHLMFPLVALVRLLLLDYTPFLAAFWGIVLSIDCSYLPPLMRRIAPSAPWSQPHGETLTPRKLIRGF